MLEELNADSARLWKEDLLKIKGLGFNTVRTWVEWNVGEPREGEYHLENLDLLLRLADEVGLRVIVQVYVDSAPEWVGTKYPEGRYAAQDGQAIPSQAAPGFCFDNKNVRKAVLGFFQEVARHATKSKAFYGWDLWSEPAALNWARVGYKSEPMFCYCPASMERFREWLQKKYGTLEKLNEAWHRTFTDWKQVEPPRYGTILTYTDFMDWRVYYGYKLAEDLKMRSDAVKAIDATHVTTSHAPNPSPLVRTLADAYDPTDDFLMKDSVNYFGTSFYPKLTAVEHNWKLNRRVLAMDLTASMTGGRGFYVGELQSGFGVHGTTIGSEVTASDLEMWTWGMVSRGARAISYYAFYPMNAGYESGGYGMIQLDGTLTERSRRAGETARKIAANADLLLQANRSRRKRRWCSVRWCRCSEGMTRRIPVMRCTGPWRDITACFSEKPASGGVEFAGIGGRELQEYKLIVLPYPLMMTNDEAAALKEYVEKGGHLFIEARPGWVNEDGHAEAMVPGFGWAEMCGVRESSIEPAKEAVVKWGDAGIYRNELRGTFQVLDEKARVVATFADGTAAGYEHAYGKGNVILLGTFAGQSNEAKPVTMHPLGGILAKWAGLKKPELKAPVLVELREMDAEKGSFVFLFNHGENESGSGVCDGTGAARGGVQEILTGETPKIAGKRFAIGTEVPPQAVRVYRINY